MQSLWMLAAAIFFAFYAVFIKFAGTEAIGSFEILFYRSFFGVIVFGIWMQVMGVGILTRYPLEHGVRSLVGTGAILAGIYSISNLNIGLAMTLNYTSPLFLGVFALFGALFYRRPCDLKQLSTLLVGFAGVVIMLSPTIAPHEYFAALVGLSAGCCTAIAVSYVKRLGLYHEPELRILFYFVLVGTIVGFIGVAVGPGFQFPTLLGSVYIFGASVCATLMQVCLTRAFSRGNIILSGALQYSVILFSTLAGDFFFNEPATPPVVCGMVLIVISGIAASYFTHKAAMQAKVVSGEPKRL